MARPQTKKDLILASQEIYDKLMNFIDTLSEELKNKSFDFSKGLVRKEAHWSRDKNVKDVVIHLYEWHQLIINWVDKNMKGEAVPFIPEPYNWRTYGDMNIEFVKKHEMTTLSEAMILFKQSHQEVMARIDTFDNDELFSKGTFSWVGGSTLGSYFVSATSSHYEWALKKLKVHEKNNRG